jgi:hypothetical protein
MSFSEWSEENRKKKKKYNSFSEWGKAKYGTTEEDDDIAPVKTNKYYSLTTQEEIQAEIDALKDHPSKSFLSGLNAEFQYILGNFSKVEEIQNQRKAVDDDISMLEQKLADRKAYDKHLEYVTKYGSLSQNADFAEKSQYKTTANGGKMEYNALAGMWTGSGFGSRVYDAINRNPDALNEYSMVRQQNDPYGVSGQFDAEWKHMTDDEIATYNYVFATQGEKSADEYLKFIKSDLYRRDRENAEAEAEAYAEEHPVMASIGSVVASPFKGISYLGQATDLIVNGEIDPNAAYNRYSYLPNAARNEVSGIVEEKWGEAGSFAYGVGMSMGDFLVNTGITGGSKLATVILGAGTAADTTLGALDRGVEPEKAFLLGASAGLIEAATEGMSIDALFGKLGGKLTKNEIVKYIFSNVASEGAEEMISETANTIADAILAEDKSYWAMAVEEYKAQGYSDDDAFNRALLDKIGEVGLAGLGGAISGGVMSTGGVTVNAISHGVQSNTRTESDEKVITKLVEDEVAKREANGETVSKRDKDKIYDTVVEQMEHGQIDIDTIESVLGGESYTAYTDHVKSEEALKKELEELSDIKRSDLTRAQERRIEELEAMNLDDTSKRDELRKALDDTLSPLLKNSRLTESYRERERRLEAFTADLSQYKGKQREAVERAIKSGVLNNGYHTHELVNILSKIEADKGIKFDYTNDKKLKEAGFGFEGSKINGFINANKDTITLNVKSAKAWQFVVGHEITHALEGTEAYDALRESLYAYAESRGELESRRAATTRTYEGKNADIESELTADLVGDYLFTDKNFIDKLTGNRTLFQKIYDEIKYLCKVATGKELTEIEKVRHEFDRAWKALSVKPSANVGVNTEAQGTANVPTEVQGVADVATETQTVADVSTEAQGELDADASPVEAPIGVDLDSVDTSTLTAEELRDLWGDDGTDIADSNDELDEYLRRVKSGEEKLDYDTLDWILGSQGADAVDNSGTPIEESGKVKPSEEVKVLEGGAAVKYSLSTWTPETQDKVRNNLVKAGYESDRVDKWIGDLNGVAAVIASDKDRLDFEAADNQVMLKNNQEYVKTLDASTLCAKRLQYQGTFNAIQHLLPNTVLTSDDLIELQNMLKEHGYEAPCSVCYVESRRRHLGKFAQEWLDGYNGEYKPNLDEVTTSDGLENLRHTHPQTYKDFVDAMNRKGSSNPKVVQLRTEYRNDIMSLTPKQVEKIEAIGGLRIQSFSDFETPHLLDMMQAVMDMSAKGLTSQAYTKVPNFAWVFGDTGIKINLSLIAEGSGLDADGNLIFSSVEGMDINEAMAVRDAYSANVGTIIVGANDAHILACMADDRIDYIIPFHRSGWGKNEMEMMGLGSYDDYTYGQNEHDLETGKNVANLYPPDYWDYNLTGKENAERYLSLCARTGREPKFSKFLVNNGDGSYSLQPDGSTDGYWKTLIDFKMYDNEGNGAAQQKVQPNFNMEEAYRILNEYEGGANSLPVANDVVEEFVSKHRDNIAPTPDAQRSLSNEDESFAPVGNYSTPLRDLALEAPVADVPVNNVGDTNAEAPAPVATTSEAPMLENIPVLPDEELDEGTYEAITPSEEKPFPDEIAPMTEEEANALQDEKTSADISAEGFPKTRKQLHNNIINDVRATFSSGGYDFDDVLSKARNLSTFSTVDNTPQRVMEKALGYKEGQILADLTVNRVAQNESAGIKWLNSFTDRKNGLLAQISRQYRINPGSNESAAAQMYAEGFYVNDNNDIVAYGDAELAKDFPNADVQRRIKGLASDPRIRRIYDETLTAINESRTRNAYPEIQKLDNYFLHFRAMDDTFSRLGLPFNPNDIRAKDLPTDLNGVTADLKPGQPYFASAMHRTGKRTSFDLLGGLERYLTSAKNQIYHIDDIQTLRALRNYIADTYGQANGLEGIDMLSEEEAQDRIEKVYNSHLSTFAKFLNEEANVLAGKTALIDRGLEGIIGRRGITFLDTVNKQVGSNMVGYSASSALVNFDALPRAFAKSNKFDFVKGFAQTVSNKISSIFGKGDSFAENSPVMIRRKGAERFYRTPFQKASDGGYVLMGVVDDLSTEIIARAKFNELTRKGMDEQAAHFETDKWVSRLLGDRSLGQQPLVFNSKMLGLVTKFQLEVRNNLDSQFYDTIQEAKASSEDIENALARNAKTAAKVTSTFVQLAVAQHLFGKAFESVAGYNPAFDIISTLSTLFGFDDEEDSEDTVLDNIEQGFLELLEDLPYTSTLTGGRIPISAALPIAELIKGVDNYGNDKSRLEILGEVAPYYILPGGYGQYKKTRQGLSMFSDEHPVSGSYTDSGNLRFPVEDTPLNRVQAAIFGQYASKNAREYFDNDYAPLNEKQIQEYMDVDMPIKDYWEYREGLSDLAPLPGNKSVTLNQKGDYVGSLDLPASKKNILINNIASDRNTPIDMTTYGNYKNFEEFDFAQRYPEKYAVLRDQGVSVEDYNKNHKESTFLYTDDYSWAADNPDKYMLSKVISDDVKEYKQYTSELNKIKGENKKEDKRRYIFNLDIDYGAKCVLFKSQYNADDTYNDEIVNYLNGREDLTYDDRVSILTELGFRVTADGQIFAD